MQHGIVETRSHSRVGGEAAAAPHQIARRKSGRRQSRAGETGFQCGIQTVVLARQYQCGDAQDGAAGPFHLQRLRQGKVRRAAAAFRMAGKSKRQACKIAPHGIGQHRIAGGQWHPGRIEPGIAGYSKIGAGFYPTPRRLKNSIAGRDVQFGRGHDLLRRNGGRSRVQADSRCGHRQLPVR
jgi:hypothetical protein